MPIRDEFFDLGVRHFQSGDWNAAVHCFQRALWANPGNLEALAYLGNALGFVRRFDEAEECYRKVLAARPDDADCYYNLGNLFFAQGRKQQAIGCLSKATELRPTFAEAFNNLGVVYNLDGEFAAAAEYFCQALRINSRFADAHNNLGSCLLRQAQIDEAEKCYESALSSDPSHREAFLNLGQVKLLKGHFEEGWPGFELRWINWSGKRPALSQPVWDGSDFSGKTLIAYADGGHGDIVQFSRYLALAKRRGGKVALACQPSLLKLLEKIDGVDCVFSEQLPIASWPKADWQVPLQSLPGIFETTLETVPAKIPYIKAEPELVAHWRNEIAGSGGKTSSNRQRSKKTIGIAWQGSLLHRIDHRSLPVAFFEKIAEVEGTRLVSLQVGPAAERLAQVPFCVQNLGSRFNPDSFADMAAAMMSLDLIITVDTASAHVAGALGVPTWVALSKVACWRWLLDRSDSPWYPTMRLFRQKQIGDWGPVFEEMAVALRQE